MITITCIFFITDPEIWSSIQEYCSQPQSNDITDICGGEGYKQHEEFLSQPTNVSLLLNTDGVAIYRSSNFSIWPVWAVVNELPTTKRYELFVYWYNI